MFLRNNCLRCRDMKEKVGVVYDSSARGVDIVSILVSRLPLSQEHVRPVSDVSVGWLRSYEVLMLVSSYWSDMFLPCEWHKFFTKIGVWTFSGRTVVPVSTSVPLSVSIAPALRRICAYYFSGRSLFYSRRAFCRSRESRRSYPAGR